MIPFSNIKRKCVLVTRPKHQAKNVIAKLRRAGAKVIHIPLIEIADPSDNFKSLDRAISQLSKYDWLIFTSQNAVEKFFERMKRTVRPELACPERSRRVEGRQRFAAVGPSTAAALKRYGIKKPIIPRDNPPHPPPLQRGVRGDFSSDGLIKVLKRYDFKGKRVLFPCAKKAKDTLPAWLKKQGAKLDKAEAYQTIMPKNINRTRLKKLIQENKVDVVLFYSESAEKNFLKIVGKKYGSFVNKLQN